MINTFSQASADRQDYDINLISSDNDTAASVGTVIVSPAGALTVDGTVVLGAKVKVWLKNGVQGTNQVQITVPITTTLGRVKNAIFYVSVT